MEFLINSPDVLEITDAEISDLLSQVYVDGGFTSPDSAISLFEPVSVRSRGNLICAREKMSMNFAGMVIIVYPNTEVARFAKNNETEMHLLGVKSEFRGSGLGRMLVKTALDVANHNGYSKMLLATQPTMEIAHRLYESLGFVRVPQKDFSRNGREFLIYEFVLNG